MKTRLLLLLALSVFSLNTFAQDRSKSSTAEVETIQKADAETHIYRVSKADVPLDRAQYVMKMYTEYLQYSVQEEGEMVKIKVSAKVKPDNMLIMKRALISMNVSTLDESGTQRSLDDFFSGYSLQR